MTSIVVAFPLNEKQTNVSIMFKPKQKTGAQKRKIQREQEKAKAKMTKLDKFFKETQPTQPEPGPSELPTGSANEAVVPPSTPPGPGSLTESAPAAGTGAPSSGSDSSDTDTHGSSMGQERLGGLAILY